MDSIFLLGETERATFLQHMMQTFGCTYICLWSYLPLPSNCLLFLDGLYKEESSQQPSSSSGSLARMLFNSYCESVNYVDHGQVPGFAFKNNLPYLEMKLDDLQRLASSQVQMQFYKEAGIKTIVFMGCTVGELELGMSSEPQVNLEMEMKTWFPMDFSRQTAQELPQTTNQNTSSSSLRSLSLSVDSIEHSPSIFNIPISSPSITQPPKEAFLGEAYLQEKLISDALSQIRNVQFPTIESENDAITKAILAVLTSSPASTSSSSQQTTQSLPPIFSNAPQAAFRSYHHGALAPVGARLTRKQNMFKRAVLFYRNLNKRRTHELRIQENRPIMTTQLHHMISERRRREKINESFQVLRSLLPPGSKKDKASVLSNTTELISSLRSQVEQLRKRNQTLMETLLSTNRKDAGDEHQEVTGVISSSSTDERANVEIARVSPSTSEARFLDLRVSLRSGECSTLDLVIRVLELLKQQRNVSLMSVQSNSRMVESVPVHGLVLRLKVEGDEFDEVGFQEALRRVVDDMPH